MDPSGEFVLCVLQTLRQRDSCCNKKCYVALSYGHTCTNLPFRCLDYMYQGGTCCKYIAIPGSSVHGTPASIIRKLNLQHFY